MLRTLKESCTGPVIHNFTLTLIYEKYQNKIIDARGLEDLGRLQLGRITCTGPRCHAVSLSLHVLQAWMRSRDPEHITVHITHQYPYISCERPIKTNEITRKLEVFNFYFKKDQLLFMSAQLKGHNEQSWLLLCPHQFCLLVVSVYFVLCLTSQVPRKLVRST